MNKLKISFISSIFLLSFSFCINANADDSFNIEPSSVSISHDINNLNQEISEQNKTNIKDNIVNVLSNGLSYIGTPYKWGGSNENGFDCSGFVRFVYENSLGFTLPRTSKEMSKVGTIIKNLKELMPGDLVFFNTRRFNFSHVGIYLGENKFIHAPRNGQTVRVEEIDTSYWTKRFNGARRIL